MSTSTHQKPEFVEQEALKTLLEDKTKVPGKDYLVIDVRDEDRIGGHIPGSVNIPSKQLPDRLPQLVEEYKDVPTLFFHCALSQVRGPKAANRWSEALAERDAKLTATEAAAVEAANRAPITQKVNILRGGFGEWQLKHKDNKDLVEAYEAEYWVDI
ncbi:hypothetical protein BX616_003772 [Lobosporangium transversale]|uniref:Rhodanese-like domain-containing protein n=1 Tax=Lobosporangium transversale TaxID=64571 RepID=A0A1Y2G987_9FUNG|nr:Rhodanese-like domain-containing protein [Lobosporangium transversale]KAF9898648.1 hypothetical protein BX616_003772 [Lobosporangium transversale]ORZ00023.1 Rhodanese-like domain-containing protein [Lobosporangium transversale]|eukprot:XP_021876064.1 Rhodanese-like domain-containing protein [Lobosporangium transversale]